MPQLAADTRSYGAPYRGVEREGYAVTGPADAYPAQDYGDELSPEFNRPVQPGDVQPRGNL